MINLLITPPAQDKGYPAVVMLTHEARVSAPLGPLTAVLAEAIAAEFCDAVAVILVYNDATRPPPGAPPGSAVTWIPLLVSTKPAEALQRVCAATKERAPGFAYTFVDASRLGNNFVEALVDTLSVADLGGLARRLVHICLEMGDLVRPPWDVLCTVLLPPEAAVAPPGVLQRLAAAVSVTSDVARMTSSGGAAVGDPYKVAEHRGQWCRVRLDLASLAATPDTTIATLPGITGPSLQRWARAVTHRRVGLALGGAGSWGYAHVALIRELLAAGLPIDVIGGASSGAIFGGYFCVLGPEGLPRAIECGLRLTLCCYLSVLSPAFLEAAVRADLGDASLRGLEVLLLPISSNLTALRAEVIRDESVSFAARASATAPGFFGPTFAGGSLYVDGSVTDSVPAAIVISAGGDLCVSSNALPSAPALLPPTGLCSFLNDTFNPLMRLGTFMRSFSLMVHLVGDAQSAATENCFDPLPETAPLLRTLDFYRAKEIVESAAANPVLQDTVRRAHAAWTLMRAPRHGSES